MCGILYVSSFMMKSPKMNYDYCCRGPAFVRNPDTYGMYIVRLIHKNSILETKINQKLIK